MRRIIDFLIKNIHSLTFTFLLSFSLIQIIDKNFYHNSKFNFYSNSIINTINDLKQNFSEYFELKVINENLIIENTLLKNNSNNIAGNDSIMYDENYTYIPAKIISNSIKFSKNLIYSYLGEIKGKIVWPPKGKNGFGYDPFFVPDGYEKTFAEMVHSEKIFIDHRSIALKKLIKLHLSDN